MADREFISVAFRRSPDLDRRRSGEAAGLSSVAAEEPRWRGYQAANKALDEQEAALTRGLRRVALNLHRGPRRGRRSAGDAAVPRSSAWAETSGTATDNALQAIAGAVGLISPFVPSSPLFDRRLAGGLEGPSRVRDPGRWPGHPRPGPP